MGLNFYLFIFLAPYLNFFCNSAMHFHCSFPYFSSRLSCLHRTISKYLNSFTFVLSPQPDFTLCFVLCSVSARIFSLVCPLALKKHYITLVYLLLSNSSFYRLCTYNSSTILCSILSLSASNTGHLQTVHATSLSYSHTQTKTLSFPFISTMAFTL